MKARLNFSTFAFLDCDLLILDEVLAVGDIVFKQKCYNRMDELIRKDTTIILVTHSVQYVNNFCNKVLVLNNGKQEFCGEKGEGVRVYGRLRHKKLRTIDTKKLPDKTSKEEILTKLADNSWQGETIDWPDISMFPIIQPIRRNNIILEQFLMLNREGIETTLFEQGEEVIIFYTFRVVDEPVEGIPVGSVLILDNLNNLVHSKDNYQLDQNKDLPETLPPGSFVRFKQKITVNMKAMKYVLRVRMLQIRAEEQAREVIFPAGPPITFDVVVPSKNILFGSFEGMADMPGSSEVQWKISNTSME